MPASSFPNYAQALTQIVNALLATGQATLVNLQIDQRSPLRGFIEGRLIFDDQSELHFREFVDVTRAEPRLMYAYHYQDTRGQLVFRYDNAAHRPPLSQAEHKHTASGIAVSDAPTLADVINEVLTPH